MTNKNYIEKIRFTLTIKNLSDHTINPTITVGLNDSDNHVFAVTSGINEFKFDEIVYTAGQNLLNIKVNETETPWDINSFIIQDLKIHGISITHHLFCCEYFPHYDNDYLIDNPSAPNKITSGLYIGNRGKWNWKFNAPINENPIFKIGLW